MALTCTASPGPCGDTARIRVPMAEYHGPTHMIDPTLYTEPPLILDFESRSDADLSEIGGRQYWAHPSTEPICLCMYYMGERLTWLPGDPAPGEFRVLAAHNASTFDRFGWEDWLGWPAPELWIDTASQARKAGMKAGLDALTTRLMGTHKDKEGNKLTLALSRHKVSKWADIPEDCRDELKAYYAARKADPAAWPDIPPKILARVVEYCGTDIDQTAALYEQHLAQWVDSDADVERVDRIINDRGICFDRELAAAILEIDARQAEASCAALGVTSKELRSNDQFPELVLLAGGPSIPNCQFATVEELTRYVDPGCEMADVVRALAEARLSLASIAKGKLTAGLARTSPDGRMRDAHKYIGAHTWRWAGQGLQPQNIPWLQRRQ
jgi:hypothetical protein